VATKVATRAICELGPACHTVTTRPQRSAPYAATMSTAASVVIGTTFTRLENSARMTSIHTPAATAAHRPTAPALRLRAVWPTEPPVGCPR
jgi:hypothetical protein